MAECPTGDVMYFGGGSGLTKLMDQGIDGILSALANAILSAAVDLFANQASNIPTFGDESTVKMVGVQLDWLVVAVAVASLLFSAARMALERRGQAGVSALRGLVRVVLVAGAAGWMIKRLATISDDYTNYIYEAGVREQLKTIAQCGTDGGTAFLLIIIGLLLLIAGIIHIILLYIRLGVMVVLTATLSLAAAASMTEWGSSWWRKHIAWMVAWLVFKPATGLVIYAGTVMVNSTSSNAAQQKIAGCGVLLLSAVALPALLRLVVPAAAALGSSDGVAGVAASGAGYAGRLASGAVAAAGNKHGSSSQRKASGSSPVGGGSGGGPGGGGSGKGSDTSGGASGSGTTGSSKGLIGAIGRAAAGAGRRTVGAAGYVAGQSAGAAGTAARHANEVAQGALPGVHDGDNR